MPQPRNDVQYLLDRAAIHDVHTRYFQGLDSGRPEQVRDCFTADVVARYDARSALRTGLPPYSQGIDELMDALKTFKSKQTGEWKITTHFMGNLTYNRLDGDDAETETNAIACVVLAGGKPDRVALRSLRYLDKLKRVGDGWRISERQHTLDWSCQVPTDFAVTMAERVTRAR